MRKIYYLVSLAILALFTACSEDYNEKNFPGYKDATTPTNIVNYEYLLTAADYNTIGNSIKKSIEDKISVQNNLLINKQNELKNATNATDSARIQAELVTLKTAVSDSVAKLKLDPLYISGVTLNTNKCFVDSNQFKAGISSILTSKYIYADTSSLVKVTFKYLVPVDTTTIASADKYELVATDYTNKANIGGLGLTTPYISIKSANPSKYLPTWLKSNYPYAASGSIKLIRYLYDNGVTPLNVYKTYKVFVYDGAIWSEYNAINTVSAKFKLIDKTWQFIKSEIFSESFSKSLGDFTSHQVSGTKMDWIWASYKGVGYAYANGFKKGAVVVWLVSPEISLPDKNNIVLSFKHAINYFTGVMNLKDLTTVNISTDYVDDVQSATWDKLDIAYPDAPSWTFINSGNINLKDYANKKIHIGIRYETPDAAQEAWELNSISIVEK